MAGKRVLFCGWFFGLRFVMLGLRLVWADFGFRLLGGGLGLGLFGAGLGFFLIGAFLL